PTTTPPSPDVSYQTAIHTLALSLTLICPAIIALPPRRLDLMTAILGGTTCVSLNHLHSERYGYGVLGRVVPSYRHRNPQAFPAQTDPSSPAEREEKLAKERTLGEKVWYGEESKEGWAEKRDREIREKFEEGKGIGDVIWEQVWEVWNWGDKKEGKEE
ncbi:hypothetical protein BDZ85DRAFT_178694, partial [Elsinoe ampelina]